MGMVGNFFRTDEATVQRLRDGKLSLTELLYDDFESVDDDCFLDIDKAWHAIHFTLSGEVWESTDDPLSKVILNSNLINDEDMGYGPAMLLMPNEVKDASNALEGVSKDWFRKKFSVSNMAKNEIYPVINSEDEEEFFDYVYENFKQVVVFFEKAAQLRECILFFIS